MPQRGLDADAATSRGDWLAQEPEDLAVIDQPDHVERVAVIRYDDRDELSAFFENDRTTPTGLAGYLKERGITDVVLCGLATDFCVGFSALDAMTSGFRTSVVLQACRAIDLDGSLGAAWAEMEAAGVVRG